MNQNAVTLAGRQHFTPPGATLSAVPFAQNSGLIENRGDALCLKFAHECLHVITFRHWSRESMSKV